MDQQTNTAQAVVSGGEKATFWQRLGAFLIDILILMVVGGFLGGIFGGFDYSDGSATYGSIPTLFMWAYLVIMDVKYGQTVGKMALKIRVQDKETGANLTWLNAFLREVIGRFLASFVLLFGYFWIIWDKDKQGWHDKIGRSVVVKTK